MTANVSFILRTLQTMSDTTPESSPRRGRLQAYLAEALQMQQEYTYERRTSLGWELDDEGWRGPDPLNPEKNSLSEFNWTDVTGLDLPEDMNDLDILSLTCMKILSQHEDRYAGINAIVDFLDAHYRGGKTGK
jgi:hypothetical protein